MGDRRHRLVLWGLAAWFAFISFDVTNLLRNQHYGDALFDGAESVAVVVGVLVVSPEMRHRFGIASSRLFASAPLPRTARRQRGGSRHGTGLLVVFACLVGVWALAGDPLIHSPAVQIAAAAVFVVILALVGLRRSRAERGSADPFHPLVMPLVYVAFSFLAPAWAAYVLGQPLRLLRLSTPLASNTTELLVVGVTGFAAGAAVHFRRRAAKPIAAQLIVSDRRVLISGRALLVAAVALSLRDVAAGSVYTRGVGQAYVTAGSSVSVAINLAAVTAATLIIAAHRLRNSGKLMARTDWLLLAVYIVLTGLRGSRNNVIAVLLVVTLAHVLRSGRIRAVVAALLVMGVFSIGVLHYRTEARGGTAADRSLTDALLGDMTVAAYTVGATAYAVPGDFPYEHGSTLGAAVVRQLPGPVAIRLIGPPHDTGNWRFRELINLSNPDQGVGFSIPAEGYLNFGRFGLFGLCAVLGMLMAWAYARFDFASGRPLGLLYPILVAGLPFGLRSDALGAIKTGLYPLIIAAVVLFLARGRRKASPSVASVTRAPRKPSVLASR